VLTWLLGWTRLIADENDAVAIANQAVARAASGSKRLTGTALRAAAAHEAARLLVRGVAAVPPDTPALARARPVHAKVDPSAYSPPVASEGNDGAEFAAEERQGHHPSHPNEQQQWDPLEQTPTRRLAAALATLAPYERLACVTYFLDGSSTDSVASLLGVSRERAIAILESASRVVALAVGDSDVPDFAASTAEVDVIGR